MNRRADYLQVEMEQIIAAHQRKGETPSLLLHSCCAPCSSYVLESLSGFFHITVFYYNPNIYPDAEYWHRVREQQEFIRRFPAKNPIRFVEGAYDTGRFYEAVRGVEDTGEGGERCARCFTLRLREAAEKARELGLDYFTTTLTISPKKDAEKLTEIGRKIAEEVGVKYLTSDFKKRGGYNRSTEIAREYGMYRQDYCGCVFSKVARDQAESK